MLDVLTIDDFAQREGDRFSVDHQGHVRVLVLAQAETSRIEPPPGRRRSFSLIFREAQDGPALGQGTYGFDHRDLGRLELFITCIGPDTDGAMRYEAVFN